MNLAIDIGNTSVKAALFEKNVLKEAHVHRFELDELLQKYRIARAIISKSGEDKEVEEQLRQKAIPYIVLSRNLNLPIGITYATPDTLGADRIAGSVAANAQFRNTPVGECVERAMRSVATCRPSRRTVTVSHSLKISSMRWDT